MKDAGLGGLDPKIDFGSINLIQRLFFGPTIQRPSSVDGLLAQTAQGLWDVVDGGQFLTLHDLNCGWNQKKSNPDQADLDKNTVLEPTDYRWIFHNRDPSITKPVYVSVLDLGSEMSSKFATDVCVYAMKATLREFGLNERATRLIRVTGAAAAI